MAKPSVKDKIMEAALDRFHALGFNACGVQEIVDVAGVPKGSFYNYFKAKEGLAVEVLALYAQGSRIEMLADRTKPPVQRLRDHFEFFVSRYAEGDFARGCLLGNLGSEVGDTMPPIREAVCAALARWTGLVEGAVRDGQADGSIAADRDAEQIARFLINAWEGALLRMKVVKTREPLDDFLAMAFESLLPRSKPGPVAAS